MENNLALPAHDSWELGVLRGTTHQITRAFVELRQYTILQEQQEEYPVVCQRALAPQAALNGSNAYRANSSLQYRHPNTSELVPSRLQSHTWSPLQVAGLSSPLCQDLAWGKSLHSPHVPCCFCALRLQLVSPCVSGLQTA